MGPSRSRLRYAAPAPRRKGRHSAAATRPGGSVVGTSCCERTQPRRSARRACASITRESGKRAMRNCRLSTTDLVDRVPMIEQPETVEVESFAPIRPGTRLRRHRRRWHPERRPVQRHLLRRLINANRDLPDPALAALQEVLGRVFDGHYLHVPLIEQLGQDCGDRRGPPRTRWASDEPNIEGPTETFRQSLGDLVIPGADAAERRYRIGNSPDHHAPAPALSMDPETKAPFPLEDDRDAAALSETGAGRHVETRIEAGFQFRSIQHAFSQRSNAAVAADLGRFAGSQVKIAPLPFRGGVKIPGEIHARDRTGVLWAKQHGSRRYCQVEPMAGRVGRWTASQPATAVRPVPIRESSAAPFGRTTGSA